MNVYPSILTDSVAEVERELGLLNSVADQLPAIQIDIIDGEFVDNLTISAIDLIGIHFGDIPIDFHLQVIDPVNYVYECKQIENARIIIGQIERMHSQTEFIVECKELGLKPGLSLDLYTPVESIDDTSWEEIAAVQVMGVEAGFQGKEFKQEALRKIKQVVERRKELGLHNLEIVVDGGVDESTIEIIQRAGADAVTPGSALWKSDNPAEAFERLTEMVSQ